MLEALIVMGLLAAAFGLLLGYAATRFRADDNAVVDRIDALLPQSQCGQCNYPGCRPYAQAIAEGRADINLCPPGGEATIHALARLLDRDPRPLDPDLGTQAGTPTVAWIDEARCIGCTLCIQACPVDAIIGAHRQMHTVIRDHCTGCELCVAPCPVDCIELLPLEPDPENWRWPKPQSGAV
ncbi:MAG: electron transport complex subunit RsxB [Ectothiorhodospiraceae bacterium]|nr:electron transport complex subunit RsxB [Ectothiorhodospiraceae bacterium]